LHKLLNFVVDLVKQTASACEDLYEDCPMHQAACANETAEYHVFAIKNCNFTCQIGCLEKDLLKQDSKPCKDLYQDKCPKYRV